MPFGIGGGKSKQNGSSSSNNVNNGLLTGALGGDLGATGSAIGNMGSELNGGPQGFANSGGFNFLLDQGTQNVNANMAARGLGTSGADMKGLETMRNGLASTYLQNYMNDNAMMGGLGLGAGGILAQSGYQSQSQQKGKSKNGSLELPSDPRLKENITHVGKTHDGLNTYTYNYKKGFGLPGGTHMGVMADEVAKKKPEAYVKDIGGSGYAGVDYSKIGTLKGLKGTSNVDGVEV